MKKERQSLKVISLFLLFMMLLCTLLSCSKKTVEEEKDGTGNSGGTVTTANPNGDPSDPNNPGNKPGADIVPNPSSNDYGGYEFRVLVRGSGQWQGNDIVGVLDGNDVDVAVYNRNKKLESEYKFVVKETRDKDWKNTAEKLGASQEDAYDMWCFKMNDMPDLGQKGYLYDLNEVKRLQLDAAYYDQQSRQEGSFANKLFFITGDMLTVDDMATDAIFYNKEIFSNLKLSEVYGKDLYQLVEEYQWTLERMQNFCRLATKDENGDGVMDRNDTYGFCWQNADVLALNISMGNRLLLKDNNDVFYLNKEDSKQIDDLQRIVSFLNSGYSSGKDWTESLFLNENQLFELRQLNYSAEFVREGIEFGVVPYPMSNDDQKAYYDFQTTYGSNCITICKTVKDLDRTASIIELLSYESMKTVTPKLVNYMLGGRSVQDPETAKMVELVMGTKTYELCYLWSTGELYSTMSGLASTNNLGVAGAIASCEELVKQSVARKLQRIQQLG